MRALVLRFLGALTLATSLMLGLAYLWCPS